MPEYFLFNCGDYLWCHSIFCLFVVITYGAIVFFVYLWRLLRVPEYFLFLSGDYVWCHSIFPPLAQQPCTISLSMVLDTPQSL